MIYKGKAHKFGDDIDTDAIIPARCLNTSDHAELASHVMEDYDSEFKNRLKSGDIVVAGRNFGCGSSREHAPVALKASGVSVVIAESFARIFYRNAFNMGLPILESSDAAQNIEEGDEVEVDLDTGEIRLPKRGMKFESRPIPPFMAELLTDGGLIHHLKKKYTG
jgi:3-isopropylmalate/(R)-2-methylmalate dehydratase small subunit